MDQAFEGPVFDARSPATVWLCDRRGVRIHSRDLEAGWIVKPQSVTLPPGYARVAGGSVEIIDPEGQTLWRLAVPVLHPGDTIEIDFTMMVRLV